MRVFGIIGLLVVVAIVGLLAKKQLTAVAGPATESGASAPAPAPKQQVEQVRQAVEAAMQQPRPMPDEEK